MLRKFLLDIQYKFKKRKPYVRQTQFMLGDTLAFRTDLEIMAAGVVKDLVQMRSATPMLLLSPRKCCYNHLNLQMGRLQVKINRITQDATFEVCSDPHSFHYLTIHPIKMVLTETHWEFEQNENMLSMIRA